jgi:hypothetical protein
MNEVNSQSENTRAVNHAVQMYIKRKTKKLAVHYTWFFCVLSIHETSEHDYVTEGKYMFVKVL